MSALGNRLRICFMTGRLSEKQKTYNLFINGIQHTEAVHVYKDQSFRA